MIIQCEKCQTKFRLDDARVKDTGVKVRCAKCRNVFTVVKDIPEPVQRPDFGSMLTDSLASDAADSCATAREQIIETPVRQELPDVATGGAVWGDSFEGATPFDSTLVSALQDEAEERIPEKPAIDDFTLSPLQGDGISGKKQSTSEVDVPGEIDFGGFDFGEPAAPVQPDEVAVALKADAAEPEAVQNTRVEPLAAPEVAPRTDTVSGGMPPAPGTLQEEPPPLSIASRRKRGPFSTALIAVIGVIVVGALAFFGYSLTNGNKEKPAQETGKISIRRVDAAVVKNQTAGDLLVISGEAANEFSKPRAAIQVKGMVFGADGKVIASKNAFCGNSLTPQQLATMPLEKIEAAMANQFGDSLANMDVAPGKTIPFVIVLAKPDKAASDYGVEAAGSSVAAVK